MKLSQLFSGETHTENLTRTQPNPAQAALLNRQVRSLVPGQTLSGEIVGRNGGEVQIKLSEDMVLNARVDQSLNIEIGKNMTFEVKSNGSALTLSPLFTNVSTDVNVLKALDMAGLPVNESSVAMTEQLMGAGMSVNRNFLLQVYREINSFPQNEISDVINLHKLGMPVNEANMGQMESYRNLTHQLVGGMDTILGAMPEVLDSMLASGDVVGATKLYQELFMLVQGEQSLNMVGGLTEGNAVAEGFGTSLELGNHSGNVATDALNGVFQDISTQLQDVVLPTQDASNGNPNQTQIMQGVLQGEVLDMVQNLLGETGNGQNQENLGTVPTAEQNVSNVDILLQKGIGSEEIGVASETLAETASKAVSETLAETASKAASETANAGIAQNAENQTNTSAIPTQVRMSLAGDAISLLDSLQLPAQDAEALRTQIMQFAQGYVGVKDFFADISRLTAVVNIAPKAMQTLQKLFSRRDFKELLLGTLKEQWTITPEEVAEPGKVEELYRKLDNQLKSLAQALENTGQNDSAAFRAVTTMNQNIDFLQQINQMYAYVQLPLKLQQRDANGELYVYANRKNLAADKGSVSALLHLDMEHLGPVDVYVTMQSSKVNTKFYVQDDEMLDFLEAHMDILTKRLQKRGYDCSFSMTTRENGGDETTEGGIETILKQEKGIVLSQYAFDVRT